MAAPLTVYRDPKTGRYKRAWHLSSKGYPRFHIKSLRNKYVHKIMIELYIGRKLEKWEDCDHRDGNKLNWKRGNLRVLDHSTHGWVSRRQAYFMRHFKEPKERAEWDLAFGEGASEVVEECQGCGEDICFP